MTTTMTERIELTIASDYVSEWGVAAGLRELLQNAIDGATETGRPYEIGYDEQHGVLRITNPGARLQRRVLLLGYTSKRDRDDMLGHFGEGLKLGIIAILRSGREVEVRTGTETWWPAIRRSRSFGGEPVLAVDVVPTDTEDAVVVSVFGVRPEEWLDLRRRVLLLSPPADVVAQDDGRIIFDADRAGQLFVRGLFVEHVDGLQYGYDLAKADVDRDRKMLSRDPALTKIAELWRAAVTRERIQAGEDRVLAGRLYALLKAAALDVAKVSDLFYIGEYAAEAVADHFRGEHGADAVAVTMKELDDATDARIRRVVPVEGTLRAFLRDSTALTLERAKERERKELGPVVELRALDGTQALAFGRAVALVRAVLPEARSFTIRPAELHADTYGLCKGHMIYVATHQLTDAARALRVIVHEAAHALAGGAAHASEEFQERVETYWQRVAAYLLTMLSPMLLVPDADDATVTAGIADAVDGPATDDVVVPAANAGDDADIPF